MAEQRDAVSSVVIKVSPPVGIPDVAPLAAIKHDGQLCVGGDLETIFQRDGILCCHRSGHLQSFEWSGTAGAQSILENRRGSGIGNKARRLRHVQKQVEILDGLTRSTFQQVVFGKADHQAAT